MKKINNKGITLIELIVSFAIVGVAIIYFFQTLYTVKKLYTTAREETQSFVDKAYVLRIVDACLENNTCKNDISNLCNNQLNGYCSSISEINDISVVTDSKKGNIHKYMITPESDNDEENENIYLYKYILNKLE